MQEKRIVVSTTLICTNLPEHLPHLSDSVKTDLIELVKLFLFLFPVPSHTFVTEHDVDVGLTVCAEGIIKSTSKMLSECKKYMANTNNLIKSKFSCFVFFPEDCYSDCWF